MAPQERRSFVWGGSERLRNEEWYVQKEKEIREVVRNKHEAELEAADRFGKLVLEWKMWRETRQELEAVAPERGLYLSAKNPARR